MLKKRFPLAKVLEVIKDKSFAPILARLANKLKETNLNEKTNYRLGKASIFLVNM